MCTIPRASIFIHCTMENISTMNSELCKSLVRNHIRTQLEKNRFSSIISTLPPVINPYDDIHKMLEEVLQCLIKKHAKEFDDLLHQVELTCDTVKQVYNLVVYDNFSEGISYGKIVMFIMFSAHMAVHCATMVHLRRKVPEIVAWADMFMEEKLQSWIMEQGGLEAFALYLGGSGWPGQLPAVIVGLGTSLAVLIGGWMAFRLLLNIN